MAGAAINLLIYVGCRGLAADLLRYYWFRLTDVAVPLGVALEAAALAAGLTNAPPLENAPPLQWGGASSWKRRLQVLLGYRWLALLILVAGYHMGDCLLNRLTPQQPRSHKIDGMEDFEAWQAACEWVTDSGKIRPGARFLTRGWRRPSSGTPATARWPRGKTYPQDARELVQWWTRLQDIYGTGRPPPNARWHPSLAEVSPERLRQLGAKYGADYLIAERSDPPLKLPLLHGNDRYGIYRLR